MLSTTPKHGQMMVKRGSRIIQMSLRWLFQGKENLLIPDARGGFREDVQVQVNVAILCTHDSHLVECLMIRSYLNHFDLHAS